MRQVLVGLSFVVLLCSVGQAQPVWTLEDMIQMGIRQCMSEHPGDPDAPRFCNCMVRRWVGLWSDYDSETWRRTGVPTRHMQEMEGVAAEQCSGGR
jgi:hypothetical protein